MASNQKINFTYRHKTVKGEYRFSSKETKEYLEIDTLYNRNLLQEISNMIYENLKEMRHQGLKLEKVIKQFYEAIRNKMNKFRRANFVREMLQFKIKLNK